MNKKQIVFTLSMILLCGGIPVLIADDVYRIVLLISYGATALLVLALVALVNIYLWLGDR